MMGTPHAREVTVQLRSGRTIEFTLDDGALASLRGWLATGKERTVTIELADAEEGRVVSLARDAVESIDSE